VTPGSKPGDNFASILCRCRLVFSSKFETEKKLSLIIKAIPEENSIKKDMLESTPFFDTEIKMYEESLPQIAEVWANAGDSSTLFPK
jgi:hypothetical protein